MISRCAHRVFGPPQWLSLQQKLSAWKVNLRSVLATMAKANAFEEAARA